MLSQNLFSVFVNNVFPNSICVKFFYTSSKIRKHFKRCIQTVKDSGILGSGVIGIIKEASGMEWIYLLNLIYRGGSNPGFADQGAGSLA